VTGAKGTNLLGVKASSRRASSASTAAIWSVWACCRCNSRTAHRAKPQARRTETYDIVGLDVNIKPQQDLTLKITRKDGSVENVAVRCRIDTPSKLITTSTEHSAYVLRQLSRRRKPERRAPSRLVDVVMRTCRDVPALQIHAPETEARIFA